MVGKKLGADELVQGVVPAYVLAQAQQVAGGVEQRRGMQTAGAVEDGLHRPKLSRETLDDRRIDDGPAIREALSRANTQGRQRRLAAHAATGGRVKVP